MIYVDEKYLTIAGKKIPGQVQSVTITEEGKIEDKKNSKGKVTKANQPTGFEAAKVEVSMYFEEDGSYTAKEQIQYIQRLFKTTKQKKQKKYQDRRDTVCCKGNHGSVLQWVHDHGRCQPELVYRNFVLCSPSDRERVGCEDQGTESQGKSSGTEKSSGSEESSCQKEDNQENQ